MLGEIGREGRDGTIIVFRLEDGTFIGKVASNIVPEFDSKIGLLVNDHVETWYEVKDHKHEVWYESGEAGGGESPGEPWKSEFGRLLTCVIVSEVT